MEILKHETDLDITHKLNNYELKAWLQHLKHLKKEILSLEKMWKMDLDDELGDDLILDQLEEKDIEIIALIDSLEHYVVAKPDGIFCEDFQCDLDLISDHEKYRTKYLTFLNHYRKLKNRFFIQLRGMPASKDSRELKYG